MTTYTAPNLWFRTRMSIHFTWYLTFVVFTAVVVTQFPEYYTFNQRLLLGICASLLFFLGIVIRQYSISFIAHSRKIPLRRVILYPIGGSSVLAKEDTRPIFELLLAVVGLLSGLIIVFILYAAYIILVITGNEMFAWLIQWLAYINILLFVVHLVPGFPLDGGRIFRAILWRFTHRYELANSITTRIGQSAAVIFLFGSIALLVNRQWFLGLLVMLLGWVLFIAATRSSVHSSYSRTLKDVTVQQIMTSDFSLVPRQTTLRQLVKDFILTTGQRRFVVYDEGTLHGFMTIREMAFVPRKKWDSTTVSQVMLPASQRTVAFVDQLASDLLDRMNVDEVNYIPVMDGKRVVGIIVRDEIIRYHRIRSDLKI